MAMAAQPTRHDTIWHLPARKPTITRALQLLELPAAPRTREELRNRMNGWRSGTEGPWGASCGTVDEWVEAQRCRDAYVWLSAQLQTTACTGRRRADAATSTESPQTRPGSFGFPKPQGPQDRQVLRAL